MQEDAKYVDDLAQAFVKESGVMVAVGGRLSIESFEP